MVLLSGRVVDPRSGHDAVADVLVDGDRVTAVGPGLPVPAHCAVVQVAGMVVGPGFIDLHSHVHTISGQRLQAMDGVTTALDLEAGLMPVDRAYRDAVADGRPLNFGFSASWGAARAQVLLGRAPRPTLEDSLGPGSGNCWSTARSWSATGGSRRTRCPAVPCAGNPIRAGPLWSGRTDQAPCRRVARPLWTYSALPSASWPTKAISRYMPCTGSRRIKVSPS